MNVGVHLTCVTAVRGWVCSSVIDILAEVCDFRMQSIWEVRQLINHRNNHPRRNAFSDESFRRKSSTKVWRVFGLAFMMEREKLEEVGCIVLVDRCLTSGPLLELTRRADPPKSP